MILVENSNFLHGLFLLKIGPEMMFRDVQDRKKGSLSAAGQMVLYKFNK